MREYTTQDRLVDFIGRELTTAELNLLPERIQYISSYIEAYTSRRWNSLASSTSPVATVRTYDGNGKHELFIDDFSSLSKIELLDSQGDVIDTLTDTDEWIVDDSGETSNSIYLRNYAFYNGTGRVKVTAIFSAGTVPAGVIMVCTQLVARLMTQAKNEKISNVKSKRLGEFSVTYGDSNGLVSLTESEIKMLDPFKRISL